MDRLAADGTSFTRARAAVPLTLPSHATILSGLLPPHHGVRENGTYRFDAARPTLAAILKARGYRTAAVVGAFVLDRQFGLDAGFDSYDDRIPRSPDADVRLESERKAGAVTDAALAWADGLTGWKPVPPFFLWVHYYDPHAPYEPPAQYAAAAKGHPYDGEVAYVDAELRRLLDGLGSRGQLEGTAIVVAGDHGESLGEHGEQTHGMLLYEAAVRVPLIIKIPGAKPAVRTDPASLVDISPTILASVGQASSLSVGQASSLSVGQASSLSVGHASSLSTPFPALDGVNLLAGLQPKDRELYAETNYPRAAGWTPQRSLVPEPWKLLRSSPLELYDVERDPGETRNLAGDRAAMASAMVGRLAQFDAGGKPDAVAPTGPSRATSSRSVPSSRSPTASTCRRSSGIGLGSRFTSGKGET